MEICQEILELLHQLRNNDIDIKITWIPGHTDNPWNDKADALANTAALRWTKRPPPVHRALAGLQLRIFTPDRGEAD